MTYNVGIVGFGARAGLWKHIHHPQEGTAVTAICDIAERGRSDACQKLPEALVTSDLNEFLGSGLDAVLVTTSDDQHVQPVLAALGKGIPVFCEKPLAISIADCDAMLQASYENRTRLYVGHNMRHMPVVRQMREIVAAGRIGPVRAVWCRHFVGHGGDFYFKDWHADRSRSTSLLLQKGAHDIDVIHWLANGYTDRVQAMGELMIYGDIADRKDRSTERMPDWFSTDNWPPGSLTGLNPVVDVEDISMMNMHLDNGVLASYQQCHFTPDYWRSYTVIGERGRIENFGDGPGDSIGIWDRRHSGHADPDEVVEIGGGDGGHGGADPKLINEFLIFARDGGPTETSPVAARMSVAAGCMATDSIRGRGETLAVPPLSAEVLAWFASGQVG
ncbi:MAG: Gfo/Idh/MocA family oxidoreductase [Propionibacteriales bacterium]|nr:Gfo/Idh/MocA family oxidoreductase [Propionibacteriales bacterium]